jgi:hypothetical protein
MNTFLEILHGLRREVDAVIKSVGEQKTKHGEPCSVEQSACQRELALAYTKLQEAKMWLGKCLEMAGSELPVEYRDEAK